jgi:hypothetical protein
VLQGDIEENAQKREVVGETQYDVERMRQQRRSAKQLTTVLPESNERVIRTFGIALG